MLRADRVGASMDVALVPAGSVVAPTKLRAPAGAAALVPGGDGLPRRAPALAWLSLDPEDADPVRLWRGVIAALRTLQPGFGRDAEAILAAGPCALHDAVVPLVAAEAAAIEPPVVLVLDGAAALGARAAEVVPSLARFVALDGPQLRIAGQPGAATALAGPLGAAVLPRAGDGARTAGTPSAAIDAALAAGRPADAAALAARAWEATLRRGEHATVLAWLDAIGPRAAADEPGLWLLRQWAALQRGAHAEAGDAPGVPPHVRTHGHLLHAADALRRGDLDRAARHLEQAAAHDPHEGFWQTADALLRAQEAFWRGHPRVAHRHFARAAGLAAIHGDRFAMTSATGHLALLAAEGGDDDAARRRLDRLEDLRDADPAVGEHPVAAAGALAEGRLLELAGACESAVAPLRRAAALAQRGGPRFEQAEARLRLATAHRACQRPARAAELEAEALAILGPGAGFGRLAGIAAAVAPAAPHRETLSPSERTILRLLPSGLSQREIGAELYLSVNTVKTHCRNIYIKLRAGSREEAVARATNRACCSQPLRAP
jgi:ATP/maltotriose-dependent transcriptional regulator MalT